MLPLLFERFTQRNRTKCRAINQCRIINKGQCSICRGTQTIKVFYCSDRVWKLGAKNLDIGTSALSQQISKLESELSIRLYNVLLWVRFPPAGLAFQQVQLALRHLDHAVDSAHSSRLSGHVTVGFHRVSHRLLARTFKTHEKPLS